MSRRIAALALAGSLTVLLVFAVAGQSALSGPILFSFSRTHGVHRDDLATLAVWLLGMACAWRLFHD